MMLSKVFLFFLTFLLFPSPVSSVENCQLHTTCESCNLNHFCIFSQLVDYQFVCLSEPQLLEYPVKRTYRNCNSIKKSVDPNKQEGKVKLDSKAKLQVEKVVSTLPLTTTTTTTTTSPSTWESIFSAYPPTTKHALGVPTTTHPVAIIYPISSRPASNETRSDLRAQAITSITSTIPTTTTTNSPSTWRSIFPAQPTTIEDMVVGPTPTHPTAIFDPISSTPASNETRYDLKPQDTPGANITCEYLDGRWIENATQRWHRSLCNSFKLTMLQLNIRKDKKLMRWNRKNLMHGNYAYCEFLRSQRKQCKIMQT